MADIIEASGLTYTILRPDWFTNSNEVDYAITYKGQPETGTAISRKRPRVIRVLEYLKEFRELPQMIRVDNGPEFMSHKLDAWFIENKISLAFIKPGRPTQNGFVERWNGNIRKELLKRRYLHQWTKYRKEQE